jgi:hypothetical protein
VIGGKILSGRTKDQNIGYIAEYLTALGIDLKEVRVVGDEERAIVDALNALRHRCTYVFTTGGIGPTHDDITADSVAKAFRMPIDVDPRALAILHEWLKATGAEMNEARLRMTRIPKGADLVLNKVPGAPAGRAGLLARFLLTGLGWWGARKRGVPLPCVTSVSTTSSLGLPRSVTSLGRSTSTRVPEGLLRPRIPQRRCAFFLELSLLFPRR